MATDLLDQLEQEQAETEFAAFGEYVAALRTNDKARLAQAMKAAAVSVDTARQHLAAIDRDAKLAEIIRTAGTVEDINAKHDVEIEKVRKELIAAFPAMLATLAPLDLLAIWDQLRFLPNHAGARTPEENARSVKVYERHTAWGQRMHIAALDAKNAKNQGSNAERERHDLRRLHSSLFTSAE